MRDHVTLKYRSLDRIFLQAYMPRLQCMGQVCTFLRWQRGFRIPSSAAFGRIGRAFVRSIERFALEQKIPVVRFQKGQCKEKVAAPYLQQAAREGRNRVVLIGTAQEKTSAWRSWKARGHEHAAHPHMEWGRQMAFVNHYYFYLWDSDWGFNFWKRNAYAPYPIWLWLYGHEWAKRQLEKADSGGLTPKMSFMRSSLGAEKPLAGRGRWSEVAGNRLLGPYALNQPGESFVEF